MEAPPDLSQGDKKIIFDELDLNLNRMIMQALLYGLYTGIVAITLWTIFSSPKRIRSTFPCTIIVILYGLSTILFGVNWAFLHRAFIGQGDNCYTVFKTYLDFGPWWKAYYLVSGITGGISTFLVDITIIWRCWALWDSQWQVILVPTVFVVGGTAMKGMQMFSDIRNLNDNKDVPFAAQIDWSLIYIILVLATTLLCTFLIIYRIVRYTPEISAARKIVEIFIESSAMYSLSLIIYVALVSKNLQVGYYADTIAAYVRAIAPTLLVGRVSAHANAISQRQKMVSMWENHPPLVGCFRETGTDNSHRPDGDQTVAGLSGKETFKISFITSSDDS
ncbi:hypothetical protein ARMGADRAFT_1061787 [Armillaria gallica]|uniref:Uncharacterized protein n=1 Tax=Armillaria gallica TaxID=47427 RepID=A0A2H3DZ65_ARMGA|nr:hypothetical protein ARMGADRAFT_1061787 [Armillaria gallica]